MNIEEENHVNDLEIACQKLLVERDTLKAELYEANKWLRNAERELEEFGLRRCDIPACNCSGYHVDHAEPEV